MEGILKYFKHNKRFFLEMLAISVPIIIQNLISSSLNIVDMIMIGQLGAAEIAAVGIGSQVFFIYMIFLFGLNSGASILTAQYWGKKDTVNIKRVFGVALFSSIAFGIIFQIIAMFFPKELVGLFSQDKRVIEMGSSFLQITGATYIFVGISMSYAFVLRSFGIVKMPMYVTFGALTLNTILNYLLIFGHFGFPKMEVAGSALATAIARLIEFFLVIYLVYKYKYPIAATFKELTDISKSLIVKFLETVMPVLLNEIVWVAGITAYFFVYSRMGTDILAAANIFGTVERLAIVVFLGLFNASAVMIGNSIGADEEDKAFSYGKRFLIISLIVSVFVGIIIAITAVPIQQLFKVEESVKHMAIQLMYIFSFVIFIRAGNIILIAGVLRGGGDSKMSLYIESGTVWLLGVPLAVIAGLVLKMPLWAVYILLSIEEVIKFILGLVRFYSKKWIKNLVREG